MASKFQVNTLRDLSVMVRLKDVRNLFCLEQHRHENNVVFEDEHEWFHALVSQICQCCPLQFKILAMIAVDQMKRDIHLSKQIHSLSFFQEMIDVVQKVKVPLKLEMREI